MTESKHKMKDKEKQSWKQPKKTIRITENFASEIRSQKVVEHFLSAERKHKTDTPEFYILQ